MKNNSNKTEEIAIRAANKVLALGVISSAMVTAYALYKVFNLPELVSSKDYYIFICLGIITTVIFCFGFKLKDDLKVNLSMLLVTACLSLLLIEFYLEFSRPGDSRTTIEVIEDLNKSGVDAYPNVLPALFLKANGLNSKDGRLYPLGGISNITTIFTNESGYFPIIETDEFGFNNPKGLYNKPVDIMLTGDSFAAGYSVHSDENIAAVLRNSGYNVISIGKASNGPLIELGSLKEYAEPLKPKIVLWLYFINDLGGQTIAELNSPILRKYLYEEDFTQNLITRQNDVDSVLTKYARKEMKDTLSRISDNTPSLGKRISTLYNIRSIMNLNVSSAAPPPYRLLTHEELMPVKEILAKSQKMVSEWGGTMYFVYLPDHGTYSNDNKKYKSKYRTYILDIANELGLPIIDIHKEVFAPHPDPLSLFPFRKNFHYNAEGYGLVAKVIAKRLSQDKAIPLKSDIIK